jgi:hypothetical protein
MTMSFERDHEHATATRESATHDDIAPGRSTRAAQLNAPTSPMISGLIQRKARDANGVAENADQAVANASSSSGQALPEPIMRKFESSLGTDLSSVRVHTGATSADAAQAVGAKAYTVGQDIHFAAGHYDPSSTGGQHLLAHEVAHTVQQRGGTPTRQNKLEVSAPTDSFEHEADQAADAMVSGRAASVATASGVMREPDPNNLLGIGPFQPNQSRHGVVYDVPTTDYKGSVVANAPSLTSEMPASSIGDPGAIPGWKTVIPAKTGNLGPFSYTTPAQEVVITGQEHSNEIKTAWDDYKNQLLHAVADAWDSGTKAKMNTYAQQAHSDPELDKLVKDMHDNYHMQNVGQKGQGTVSDQAGKTNVYDGQNAPDIGAQVAAKGDMKKDLDATAKAGQNGTVEGPVGKVITDLKAERLLTAGSVGRLDGFQTQMDASQQDLVAGNAQIEIDDLNEKIEDDKKKKEEIENGQRTLKKIDPELARLVKMVQDNSAKLKTLGGMVKAAPEAMEGDVGAILEIGKGILEVSKWGELEQIDNDIAAIADQVKAKYKLKNEAKLMAAKGHVAAAAKLAQAEAKALMGHLLREKKLHDDLAEALEKNWQGKDKKDGKLAAQALRALPVVRKVIRTLMDIKSTLPPLPDASTRASQGFTLATKGVGAPGAADLLKVAGWIAGSPKAIDPELKKWTDINAQLESVTAGLGLS